MMNKVIKTDDYEGPCRRETSNGVSKLIWTVMMSACGVVFIGFMAWMTSMNGKLTSLDASTASQALTASGRISVLETFVQTIDERLNRMEVKMDQLLTRSRTP